VKHLTLDFPSGHDLGDMRLSPELGSALGVVPAWDSLSPPLSAPLSALRPLSLSLFLKKKNTPDLLLLLLPSTHAGVSLA